MIDGPQKVELAQHAGTMGGIAVPFQAAFCMVILEKSAVGTNPQQVAIGLQARDAPVLAEGDQTIGEQMGFQTVAGLLLDAAHPVVDAGTNGLTDVKNGMYGRGGVVVQAIPSLHFSLLVQVDAPQVFVACNPYISLSVFVDGTDVFTHQLM